MALSDMLIGQHGPVEDMAGLEVVARAARLVLATGLNARIDSATSRWATADAAFEGAGYDVGVSAQGVEHVLQQDVHQGPHRSLLASSVDRFPMLSVVGYAVRPAASSPMQDVHRVVEVSLLVEFTVIAGPIGTIGDDLFCEALAHRRVERTAEAVLATIGANEHLLGTVQRVGEPKGGIVNSSWIKTTDGGAEQRYVCHGARFQYAAIRLASRYR